MISEAIVNFVRVGTYSNKDDIDKTGKLEHGRKMPKGLTLPDQAEMNGKGVDGPFEARWGEILDRKSFPDPNRDRSLFSPCFYIYSSLI